ncbi:MAG: hypothetical protein IJW60_01800 [Clostridia bacterium]|nr:hypothetical protein [Clostridia bacterium]
MENYVKTILYAFPLLANVEEDYQLHIQNKAVLSYRSDKSAWEFAEYLAGEVCEKQALLWLKATVQGVLDTLTDVERALVGARYFGKRKRFKETLFAARKKKNGAIAAWSERQYFRFQKRLGEKLAAIFKREGLTAEVFEKTYAQTDIFRKIYRAVCEGKDRKITQSERRWLGAE